jgi:FMN phosphatase YigB (HAD superfamily)
MEPAPLQPLDARLQAMHGMLREPAIRVVSVDVFDTLVWRKVAEATHAFALLGQRLRQAGMLGEHVRPDVFAALRELAERRARTRLEAVSDAVEVNLDEIYAEFGQYVFAPGITRAACVTVELEIERELLIPDLNVAALLRVAADSGKRLIAVSDTYFSESFIRSLLLMPTLGDLRFERVFVSNAYRKAKAKGLFKIVLEQLGCIPEQMVHLGDDPQSDVRAPRSLGIHAVHFERRSHALRDVLAREAAAVPGHILDPYHGDYGLTALRSKISHRTQVAALPVGLRPFWQYGAVHFGPIFSAFADWVVGRAKQWGIPRVFCLMREGEVLVPLIDAAARATDTEMETEPLWLSRQLCARAAVFEGTEAELRAFLSRRRPPTLRQLCETLGLGVADLPEFTNHADSRLNDPQLTAALLETLTGEAHLRARIVATAHAKRQRVMRYLEAVASRCGDRLVMVDIGWAGTTQRLTQQLLENMGLEIRPTGLYLLTNQGAHQALLEGLEMEGFLGNGGFPTPHAQTIMRVPEIVEQICMPDHGSQVDLTADLEPILEDPGRFRLQNVQRSALQQGIQAFQSEWLRYQAAFGDKLVLYPGVERQLLAILWRCLVAPTGEEARLLGSWEHEENFGSQEAEAITGFGLDRSLRYMDPEALSRLPMDRLYWPYGLAANTDELTAMAVAAVASGQWSPDAFRSEVEVGEAAVYIDVGGGFSKEMKHRFTPYRNRYGLSYIRGVFQGPGISRIRFDPSMRPAIIRLDWLRLRAFVPGQQAPREIMVEGPQAIGKLLVLNASRLLPQLLYSPGQDPQVIVDVRGLVGAPIQELELEIAFAALPMPRPPVSNHAPGDFVIRGVNLTFAKNQLRRRLQQVKRILLEGRR